VVCGPAFVLSFFLLFAVLMLMLMLRASEPLRDGLDEVAVGQDGVPHDSISDRTGDEPMRVLGAWSDEDAAAAQSLDKVRSEVLAACLEERCDVLRLLRGCQGRDAVGSPSKRAQALLRAVELKGCAAVLVLCEEVGSVGQQHLARSEVAERRAGEGWPGTRGIVDNMLDDTASRILDS